MENVKNLSIPDLIRFGVFALDQCMLEGIFSLKVNGFLINIKSEGKLSGGIAGAVIYKFLLKKSPAARRYSPIDFDEPLCSELRALERAGAGYMYGAFSYMETNRSIIEDMEEAFKRDPHSIWLRELTYADDLNKQYDKYRTTMLYIADKVEKKYGY